MPKLVKFFEICAEVLVPKLSRAEVRLPGFHTIYVLIHKAFSIPIKGSRCMCGPGMKPGCICKEGFVRDGNNDCVPEYPFCAPKCNKPYEEFQMCPCDQECNKPKVKVFELVIFS